MLEDWLSPLIEEKLILGLAWLETLGVDVHSHIYEDDGSNLRIKVALDLTSAGVVQILEVRRLSSSVFRSIADVMRGSS